MKAADFVTLNEELVGALVKAGVAPERASQHPFRPADDRRFGDFQSNAALACGKALGRNPREVAQEVMGALVLPEGVEASIAGPGFLNLTLSAEAWTGLLREQGEAEGFGVVPAERSRRIVVDFSAPNVAKPMHVGHIRSTILGDCLSRVARRKGHTVLRDNHLGDWGTQFGMVIWAWKRDLNQEALGADPLGELLRLYRLASEAKKGDGAVAQEQRDELVALQAGDEANLAIWKHCVALSLEGLREIYQRLGVEFDEWLAESSYHEALPGTIEELEEKGLVRDDQGALCVFSGGEKEPGEDPFLVKEGGEWVAQPLLVRKRDGGYNYATTDVATICHRVRKWKADAIWYVVDKRQSLHFSQLFDLARRMGFVEVELEHVDFGTILGRDGKPLKTRAGDLPQLGEVLADAVRAARVAVEERSRLEEEGQREALAELVGISAVKFTELSHHRSSDYSFDLEKMVALEGDTAPYLFYSYVRARSIRRKLEGEGQEAGAFGPEKLRLEAREEVELARLLLNYPRVIDQVLEGFRPNLLANLLLEMARAFHSFFEACPVLKAEELQRSSRLALCEHFAAVLRDGLGLLGLEVPEEM